MSDTVRISNRIRRLRFDHDEMTQEELANLAGCTRQTIIALEQGKYLPSIELAFKPGSEATDLQPMVCSHARPGQLRRFLSLQISVPDNQQYLKIHTSRLCRLAPLSGGTVPAACRLPVPAPI